MELVEAFAVVGIDVGVTGGKRACIKWSFPEEITSIQGLTGGLDQIKDFCFPKMSSEVPMTQLSVYRYTFSLTLRNGEFLHGFCCKLLPPPVVSKRYDVGERYAEVLCLISRRFEIDLQYSILDCLAARRLIDPPSCKDMLASLMGSQLPAAGEAFRVRAASLGVVCEYNLVRPRIGEKGYASDPLRYVSPRMLHHIMGAIMCEHRIIFIATHEWILSDVIHGLMQLLYPFVWLHMFVPILPEKMIDYLGAPSPYIAGVLRHLECKLENIPLGEVFIVDLDKNEIKTSQKVLPFGDIEQPRRSKMDEVERIGSIFASDIASIHRKGSDETLLRTSWIAMNIYMFGYCDRFVDSKTLEINKTKYLSSVLDLQLQSFMGTFVHTQMFNHFVERSTSRNKSTRALPNRSGACRDTANFQQGLEDQLYFDALKNVRGEFTFGDIKNSVKRFVPARRYATSSKVLDDVLSKLPNQIKKQSFEHYARTSYDTLLRHAYLEGIWSRLKEANEKNWKYAFNALKLLKYLLAAGCEAVIGSCLVNLKWIMKFLRCNCSTPNDTAVIRRVAAEVYMMMMDVSRLAWYRSPKYGHPLFIPARKKALESDEVKVTSKPLPEFINLHCTLDPNYAFKSPPPPPTHQPPIRSTKLRIPPPRNDGAVIATKRHTNQPPKTPAREFEVFPADEKVSALPPRRSAPTRTKKLDESETDFQKGVLLIQQETIAQVPKRTSSRPPPPPKPQPKLEEKVPNLKAEINPEKTLTNVELLRQKFEK